MEKNYDILVILQLYQVDSNQTFYNFNLCDKALKTFKLISININILILAYNVSK